MTRSEKRPSLIEILDKRFDLWLEQALEDADSSEGAETIKRKFIHAWYNELEAYRNAFKDKYKNQIRQNDQCYPRKWMEDDNLISALLKKYPLIVDILNTIEARKNGSGHIYLLDHKGEQYKECPEIKHCETWIAGYGKKENPLAVFIADARFYDTILPGLGIARITLQKYLKAFCNAGILKKLPRTGQFKSIPIYAIGYFSKWNDRYKLNRFLTIKDKEALRGFILE